MRGSLGGSFRFRALGLGLRGDGLVVLVEGLGSRGSLGGMLVNRADKRMH